MTPSPTPQSRSISTFTTSRIAARPRVIPLYATSIPRRVRRPLFIHQNLPSKPYIRVDIQPIRIEIPPINILSGSSSDEPESPLTPVEEQASAKGDRVLSQSRVIMIPRPRAVTIATAGWSQAALKEYRVRNFINSLFSYLLDIFPAYCQASGRHMLGSQSSLGDASSKQFESGERARKSCSDQRLYSNG